MNAKPVGTLKMARLLLCLLFVWAARPVWGAEPPAGRVVWWGQDDFWKNVMSRHTNGLLDFDNEFLTNVVAVAGGQWMALTLQRDGTVLGFGHGFQDRNNDSPKLTNGMAIAVQGGSAWAIRRNGTVARWAGQFGEADPANIVAGLSNLTAIAWAGGRSYLGLTTAGTVVGFCLDPPAPARPFAVNGQVLSNIVAVATGDTPLVLTREGAVFSLEYHPAFASSDPAPFINSPLRPFMVDGRALTNVVALASGDGHYLSLKRDGTLAAWGNHAYGMDYVPAGLSNVTAIAAANQQSLALKQDGTVVAWGNNYFGQTNVPPGLSNVVAMAASMQFNLAITTDHVPSSVYIKPHGRLETLAADADLVFKGRVLSTHAVTNAAFPDWGKPFATEFEVISVIKGGVPAGPVRFYHMTGGPMAWSGAEPPHNYHFEAGQPYLVFAARADKPDWLYSPATNAAAAPEEFRQLMHGEYAYRAPDDRPISGLPIKQAFWEEFNRWLTNGTPTNVLYAIKQLDSLSQSGRSDDFWRRSDDFKRERVLSALLPLITSTNAAIANQAIDCFGTGPDGRARLEAFTDPLIREANDGPTSASRLKAIAALSGTHFEAVTHSLAELLSQPDAAVRAEAVGLLTAYPGAFAEAALRDRARDESPAVRAAVAGVIGSGRLAGLLPVLTNLLADPLGRTNQTDPAWGNEQVHASAGNALLQFDVEQVSNVLTANLDDAGFRQRYLCKLAEKSAGAWLTNLVETLEARRVQKWNEALASGIPQTQVTNYFRAIMALANTDYQCWNIIFNYLDGLAPADFAGGRLDRCLDALENAGSTGSQEPTKLYELYRRNGLDKRAAELRRQSEQTAGFDMSYFFNRVDAQYTNSPAVPKH